MTHRLSSVDDRGNPIIVLDETVLLLITRGMTLPEALLTVYHVRHSFLTLFLMLPMSRSRCVFSRIR